MALYAISDLHLAFTTDKPMDIFGEKWLKHDEKIKENWINKITDEDTVLIAGDISWSMNSSDSKVDLDWINSLPGKKIISKGNHDYWWSGITKLNNMYQDMKFLQNNFYVYKDYAICGSRGWVLENSEKFTDKDRKILNRELIRMRLSLNNAKEAGFNKFIVMIHYPPINEKNEFSVFTDLFKEYNVEKVIYGHLHGPSLATAFNGVKDDIDYLITSCDYLNFDPIKILD